MKKRLIELGVVVVILGIAILIIPASYSKYESKGGSEAEIQYAFYLLKADYFTKNIKLMDIVPRNDSYEYVFTVSNFDGDKRLETDLEYDLWISATTNLPLDYKLYLNVKTDPNYSDILRNTYDYIIPAYHMNKEHWNTIIIDEKVDEDLVKELIEQSYQLTK